MNISYKIIVNVKLKVAILKLVNLKSLMVPTHMKIVIKSDISQFLSENHQLNSMPNPKKKPMTSITLIFKRLKNFFYFLTHFALVIKAASIKLKAMHKVPYIQHKMIKIILITSTPIPKKMRVAPTIMIPSTTRIST